MSARSEAGDGDGSKAPDRDRDHHGPADRDHDRDTESERPDVSVGSERSMERATGDLDFGADIVERTNAYLEGLKSEAEKKEKAQLEKLTEALRDYINKDPSTRGLSESLKSDILQDALDRATGNRAQDWLNIDEQWAMPDMLTPESQDQFTAEMFAGAIALGINYVKMYSAGVKGSDKYFHCMGHCAAASMGSGGRLASKLASVGREQSDLTRNVTSKGMTQAESIADCLVDTWANERGSAGGRNGTGSSGERCSTVCGPLKVKGL